MCARRFPLGHPSWHTLSSARPEEPGEDTAFLESGAWRGPGHPYLLQGQAQDPSLDPAPLSGGHTPPAAPPAASHTYNWRRWVIALQAEVAEPRGNAETPESRPGSHREVTVLGPGGRGTRGWSQPCLLHLPRD